MDTQQAYVCSTEMFDALRLPERTPIRILKHPQILSASTTVPNGVLRKIPRIIVPPINAVNSSQLQAPNLKQAQQSKTIRPSPPKLIPIPNSQVAATSNASSQLIGNKRTSDNSSNQNSDSSFEVDEGAGDYDDDMYNVDSHGSEAESDETSPKTNQQPGLKISNVVTLTPQEMRRIRSNKSNHIKRPLNAFMAYSKVQRRKIMDAYPEMHHAAVSKKLGATWKAFTPEEKKPYYEEAKRLAEEHMLQYPGYKYKPRPKKVKLEESYYNNMPTPTSTFAPEINNDNEVNDTNTVTPTPAGRISPSNFHAWSLIYESEEEEEEAEEEVEDSD